MLVHQSVIFKSRPSLPWQALILKFKSSVYICVLVNNEIGSQLSNYISIVVVASHYSTNFFLVLLLSTVPCLKHNYLISKNKDLINIRYGYQHCRELTIFEETVLWNVTALYCWLVWLTAFIITNKSAAQVDNRYKISEENMTAFPFNQTEPVNEN